MVFKLWYIGVSIEKAKLFLTNGDTEDDSWTYIPAVFGALAGIAVLAVIIYLMVHVCPVRAWICGDSERLVRNQNSPEKKGSAARNSQKNSAFLEE